LKINFTFSIIALHSNLIYLNLLKNYFSCGNIYIIKNKYVRYQVHSTKDLKYKIFPHFIKYKLQTEKKQHEQVFYSCLESILNKNLTKKEKFLFCIDKAYNINHQGKYRKINKQDMIKKIKEMKV
jgi:hypothetical protein